jgi:hypothetical protein
MAREAPVLRQLGFLNQRKMLEHPCNHSMRLDIFSKTPEIETLSLLCVDESPADSTRRQPQPWLENSMRVVLKIRENLVLSLRFTWTRPS